MVPLTAVGWWAFKKSGISADTVLAHLTSGVSLSSEEQVSLDSFLLNTEGSVALTNDVIIMQASNIAALSQGISSRVLTSYQEKLVGIAKVLEQPRFSS